MDKDMIAAASFYKRARYFNERYSGLPTAVRDEVTAMCAVAAESVRGVIALGFYADGTVFVEANGAEDDFNYDEIGARLLIDGLMEEKKEMFRALQLWYAAFMTDEGKEILQGK